MAYPGNNAGTYNAPALFVGLGADGLPARRAPSPYQDGFAIPHVLTFEAMLNASWQQYWGHKYDEAYRLDDQTFRLVMWRQLHFQTLLSERLLALQDLEWEVEPDDAKDPHQVACADGLAKLVKGVPEFYRLIHALHLAVWPGRSGSQLLWQWDHQPLPVAQAQPALAGVPAAGPVSAVAPRRCLRLTRHRHVNGDKLRYKYDGTPMLEVYSPEAPNIPGLLFEPTDDGAYAAELRGGWRNRFVIHKHWCLDADFFDEEAQDAIHGVGLRSALAWSEWLRQEWLAHVAAGLERFADGGIRVWLYPMGNPAAEAEVRARAKDNSDRVNIVVPYDPATMKGTPMLDVIPMPVQGVEALMRLIEHLEYWQQRLVKGRASTSAHANMGGLGGGDIAETQEDDGRLILKGDARGVAETLTGHADNPGILWVMFSRTYPEYVGKFACPRFRFVVPQVGGEQIMGAVQTFCGLGGLVKADQVRRLLPGLSKPEPGDETLGGAAALAEPGGPFDPGGDFGDEGGDDGPPEPFGGTIPPERYDRKPAGDGHWVTVGGARGEDGKHHGGHPVFIRDGRVEKGHPDANPGLTHRQAMRAERETARKGWEKEARRAGVKPAHLHQLAAEMLAHDKEHVKSKKAMLKDARDALSEFGGKHKLLGTGEIDQGDVRGMDEVAEHLARRHPHAFHERAHLPDQLHDMLVAGNPEPMTEDDAYDQALSHLVEHKRREDDLVPFGAGAVPEQYGEHRFSSTQVNLPPRAAARVRVLSRRVPDEDLAADGREEEPHVTVKYGLHTGNAEKVRRVVEGFGPVKATLGKTSLFPAKEAAAQRGGDQYDVVKLDVDSPDLHRLNRTIAEALACTDTHPEYKPHVTLAYVKPGRGEGHAGLGDLEGMELTFTELCFSDHDGARTCIDLTAKPPEQYAADAPDPVGQAKQRATATRREATRHLSAVQNRHLKLASSYHATAAAWVPFAERLPRHAPHLADLTRRATVAPSLDHVTHGHLDQLIGLSIDAARQPQATAADRQHLALLQHHAGNAQEAIAKHREAVAAYHQAKRDAQGTTQNAALWMAAALMAAQPQAKPPDAGPRQYGYDPSEPRLPAGNPLGGEWTARGSGVPAPGAAQPATPAPAAARPATPRHAALSATPVQKASVLGGGCNETQLVTLADGSKGVFKPADGERPGLRRTVPGDCWRREVAASELAELLGLGDLVPATVARDVGGRQGSLQAFVGDAEDAVDVPREARYDGPEDLARAAAFDFVTLNTDRHASNWMLAGRTKLTLIDNGLSFPDAHHYTEYGNSQLLGQALERDLPIPESVKAWAGKETEVRAALERNGLAGPQLELTVKRLKALGQAAADGRTFRELWAGEGIKTIDTLVPYLARVGADDRTAPPAQPGPPPPRPGDSRDFFGRAQ